MVTVDEEFIRALDQDESQAIERYATWMACAMVVTEANFEEFVELMKERYEELDEADDTFGRQRELLGFEP